MRWSPNWPTLSPTAYGSPSSESCSAVTGPTVPSSVRANSRVGASGSSRWPNSIPAIASSSAETSPNSVWRSVIAGTKLPGLSAAAIDARRAFGSAPVSRAIASTAASSSSSFAGTTPISTTGLGMTSFEPWRSTIGARSGNSRVVPSRVPAESSAGWTTSGVKWTSQPPESPSRTSRISSSS